MGRDAAGAAAAWYVGYPEVLDQNNRAMPLADGMVTYAAPKWHQLLLVRTDVLGSF